MSRTRTPLRVQLANVTQKLEWSAGGEWSVPLKPAECALLLAELKRPPSRRATNRKAT